MTFGDNQRRLKHFLTRRNVSVTSAAMQLTGRADIMIKQVPYRVRQGSVTVNEVSLV